jgi:malate synthase
MEMNVLSHANAKTMQDTDFLEFLEKVSCHFKPMAKRLLKFRRDSLLESKAGMPPTYNKLGAANIMSWTVDLPDWCKDQRNQMTGPADNAELVVKLLNSNSPGVMLDLEDSMCNKSKNLITGLSNARKALTGELTYNKRGKTVGIKDSSSVVFVRPRGMHVTQKIVSEDGTETTVPAPVFDLCSLLYVLDLDKLKHPPCIYIPKSESAGEALWWNSLFSYIESLKGWETNTIRCMALVESHPLAYQIEEFAYILRDRIMGLNLGRWDYLASLFDYMYLANKWIMPDRNTIPLDVPFFQNLRHRLALVCHKHGMLAIGGMTALYPSRTDAELNARALESLDKDKKNEAACLMDGAWTGHPDQNEIAVAAFPEPNQLDKTPSPFFINADLREHKPVGFVTEQGTRDAIRTCIRYRRGVLDGAGASLLDGYMEDLATDRIYRILICQRIDRGVHTRQEVQDMFIDETGKLIEELPDANWLQARDATWQLIKTRQFNPL